ncbi:MAG TPA: pilin [Candidatus Saccharimonas sp.]|nr:pilin [Candidatus Saccharimonas sp.]
MHTMKLTFAALLTVVGISFFATPVYAACDTPANCLKESVNATNPSGKTQSVSSFVKTIVNVLLTILGSIAVIMIVIGGIRYTVSNGDTSAVTGAKNTILYAVIGLIVAIMAYAIVNFVIDNFVK